MSVAKFTATSEEAVGLEMINVAVETSLRRYVGGGTILDAICKIILPMRYPSYQMPCLSGGVIGDAVSPLSSLGCHDDCCVDDLCIVVLTSSRRRMG
jgi:hypothetical protein